MHTPDHKDPDSTQADAALRQAWHRVSDEQPSSRLDASILASAHEAVRNRDARVPTTHGRWRSRLTSWQPVAAAAAVTGLAFALVQMLPRDHDVAPALRPAAPAVDAEPKVLVRPPVQNEADPPGPAVKRVEAAKSERDGTVVPAPAAAPAAPVDEPPPEAVTRQETATDRAAEVERRNVAAPAMSAGAAQGGIAATASASAARRDAVASVNAEDWAARVAALYDAGTVTEAADALRAFRAAYPDADEYLPEPLRDWARTIE